ncbi:MAG: hypothetical protein ACR5LA_06375 [Wolbachia sp.]
MKVAFQMDENINFETDTTFVVSVQDSGKSKSEFTTNGVIRVADTGIQQNLCIRSAEWQNKIDR